MKTWIKKIICRLLGHKQSKKYGDVKMLSHSIKSHIKLGRVRYKIFENEHCQRCNKIVSSRVIKRDLKQDQAAYEYKQLTEWYQ